MSVNFNFISGAYTGKSRTANPRECINLIYLPDDVLGKKSLINTPGLETYIDTQHTAEVRGMSVMKNVLYIVVGDKLFYKGAGGVLSEVTDGDRILTKTGPVDMVNNGTYLKIDDGSYGYVYKRDSGSLTKLNEERYNFLGGGSSTFLDGYFLYHVADTEYFYRSTVHNPLEYDVNENNRVMDPPGDIMKIHAGNGELIVFKNDSMSIFENTGDSEFAFQQRNGSEQSIGLGAKNSVVTLDNTIFWFTDQRSVMVLDGYTPRRKTPPQVEWQFEQYNTVSDAVAFGYELGGLTFYQLNFPTENASWLYEVKTNNWVKLKSYQTYGHFDGRHRANCYAKFNGMNLVGDYENGKVYQIKDGIYQDDGHTIHREVQCPVDNPGADEWSPGGFQFDFEPAVGNTDETDPVCLFKYSRDGGYSWSNTRTANLGKKGEYNREVKFHRVGTGKKWVINVRVSDPVNVVITEAKVLI